VRVLLENWRRFLSESKNAVPMFKKAKIKPYIDLGLFVETEGDEMTPRGSVVVIFDEEGRVLILLRPKTVSWGAGKWALPGGHVEPGETPMMAAVREVREETTLAVPNPRRFHVSADGEIYYYVAKDYDGEVKIDFEHDDFAWVHPEDLTNYNTVEELEMLVQRAREAL
jgi:8-oxo-dGTP diphosphatase